MKWIIAEPKAGDIIRVKVSFYYHYGIYLGDGKVVQFGLPDNTGLNPDEIAVMVSDTDVFLNGKMLETASLSIKERLKRRSPEDTIKIALARVGETGYNILHNNCEHFVNDCVFGEKSSVFLKEVRKGIRDKLDK